MVKLELRDRIEDGSLDLSISELEEVPIKELIAVKHKVKKLDLSNNQITTLPPNFANQMTLLVELDLSKNQITEVPENFGLLVNLVHLDLFNNKIERLPLSFKDLTKLRWLDLKDNPLTPQLAKIAGPCVDQSDCQKCAREVVMVMQEISRSIEEKKLQKVEDRQHGAPKEKKKRKKNKGGDKQSQASSLSGVNNQLDKEVSEPEVPGHTSFKPDAKSKAKWSFCPFRLCCSIIRALLWSLIMVVLFIGALYFVNLPVCQPYVSVAVQYYTVVATKITVILGNLPDHINTAYDWLKEFILKFISWVQNFIINELPVYLNHAKILIIDYYIKISEYITQLINNFTKKD